MISVRLSSSTRGRSGPRASRYRLSSFCGTADMLTWGCSLDLMRGAVPRRLWAPRWDDLTAATGSIHVRFRQRSRHPRLVNSSGYDQVAVMSTGVMATTGETTIADDEWFGEGSAFDSGEDLAAALFALAGTTGSPAVGLAEVVWPVPAPEADSGFVEVQRPGSLDG